MVIVLGLLLIGVGLSASCAAESWAVVIGISEYADPAIVPLHFAATDAQEIGRTLVEHCGVPEEHLTTLLNEAATGEAILEALGRISELAGPSDHVFIYVAGHGATTPDLDGDEADGDRMDEALLVYDSMASDPQTFLLDDTLGDWIDHTLVRSVAIFFDACHSGGQSRSLETQATSLMIPITSTADISTSSDKEEGDTLARDLLTSLTTASRGVLAACGSSEMAYESRGLGHGVFTHFLITALRDPATDLDGDGTVLMEELGAVVIQSVTAWGEMRSEKQTPVFEQVQAAEIVIIPRVSPAPQALVMFPEGGGIAPLEGFVELAESAPIPLEGLSLDHARRFRFAGCLEDGSAHPTGIVPGGIAPMDDQWITADPNTGYVYAISLADSSARVFGRLPRPAMDIAVQSGILYASFSPETNALMTYDLLADFAPQEQILGEPLPLDSDELTGVAISGSTLFLVGWSQGVQTLVIYDLRHDRLTFAAPIAGRGCLGLQQSGNGLYSLDARHGFLVQLNWSDNPEAVNLSFVTDLAARTPDGWLPYDPRGEQTHLGGFCFTDTQLLLSTSISDGIDEAELFEIRLEAPLVRSDDLLMAEPEAFGPMVMTP
ncbi:caspase family protein [Candidatus Bipolaricaulota bacterium]|nr:caspase family protein [Candidatus Bipolaricaulota bacterium]